MTINLHNTKSERLLDLRGHEERAEASGIDNTIIGSLALIGDAFDEPREGTFPRSVVLDFYSDKDFEIFRNAIEAAKRDLVRLYNNDAIYASQNIIETKNVKL